MTTDAPTEAAAHSRRPRARALGSVLVVIGIGLAAFNLRPAVTSVGPLLEEVRAGLGMSGAMAGFLTAFPALCFVIFGSAAPRLVRRLGPAAVLCLALVAVTIGLALRPYVGGTSGTFVAFSALALGGIEACAMRAVRWLKTSAEASIMPVVCMARSVHKANGFR